MKDNPRASAVRAPHHSWNVGAANADVAKLGIAHGGKLIVSPRRPARRGDTLGKGLQRGTNCAPDPMQDRRILMGSDRRWSAKRPTVPILDQDCVAHQCCSASSRVADGGSLVKDLSIIYLLL
jgi:hypothetical protein